MHGCMYCTYICLPQWVSTHTLVGALRLIGHSDKKYNVTTLYLLPGISPTGFR